MYHRDIPLQSIGTAKVTDSVIFGIEEVMSPTVSRSLESVLAKQSNSVDLKFLGSDGDIPD
jgi:hypothetical protein